MRCLERNKSVIYYSLFLYKQKVLNDQGKFTGEYQSYYSNPIELKANVSPATGTAIVEQFGTEVRCDKVIVTHHTELPIDENSIIIITEDPEIISVLTSNENEIIVTSEGKFLVVSPDLDREYSYNYVVNKVARSLNSLSIAISKVNVK